MNKSVPSPTNKCSVCKQKKEVLRSAIKNGQVISNICDRCLANTIGGADLHHQGNKKWQQREYAKDTVQPWEEGFAKAYGEEKARAQGWSDDDLRRHG